MYNPADDNELDNLSREAAREYRAPGAANWEVLQTVLDKELPVEKKKRRFFIFWWIFPILLAGSFAFWMSNNGLPKESATQIPEKTQAGAPLGLKNENEVAAKSIQADKPAPTLSNKWLGLRNTLPGKRALPFHSDPVKNNQSLPPGKQESPRTEPVFTMQLLAEKNEHSNLSAGLPNTAEIAAEIALTTTSSIKDSNAVTPSKFTDKQPDSLSANEPIQAVKKQSAKNNLEPQEKGWSLALLAGVDASTVKFKYSNDAGYSMGLITGFHFNKNWSIHTGAIYTRKNYKLSGNDFTPPKGSWMNYYTIETVDGYCGMWEIPLQARYRISGAGNHNWYLSGGLSSYFMNKEFYNYFYHNNGAAINRSAEYPSSDSHILSFGHISAVFEKRISHQLSLQMEPYAKIPFQGVGLGNIQLSSFGINLSLAFRKSIKTSVPH